MAHTDPAAKLDSAAPDALPLLWEVSTIAAFIGRTPNDTFKLLQRGLIPGKKVRGRWVANRDELQRFFSAAQDDGAPADAARKQVAA